jgi:GT2 family glycosyltransferase
MTIGVVITNYNSWDIAIQCVEAHLRFAGYALEKIILVDDCSTKHSDYVFDPKVCVVRNSTNLGFVKSVNVGFRNLDTDIVLLFDADAAPLMDYSEWIRNAFSKDASLGIVGFTTFDKDHHKTGSSETEPGALSLILGQQLYHRYQHFLKQNDEKLVVYSCTMAVRKKAFDSVGGFDENFDWLDPDNDFCMSVRKKGWNIQYSGQLEAYHEGGGTPQLVSHRVLRFYKNRWYLLRKHGKIKNAWLAKNLILARLRLEYGFLKLFGKAVFKDPVVFEDKLTGRKKIIEFCRQTYH